MSIISSDGRLGLLLRLVAISAYASASEERDALMIPNIQNAGRGYDVLYGNPRPTGGKSDGGWRDAVFDYDYSQGTTITTATVEYKVPKDFEVRNVGSCQTEFTYSAMSSSFEYKKELETTAAVEGGGWGASFKASADYKKVNENSQSSNTMIIESKAQCSIWDVSVVSNAAPHLTANFRQAVLNLPPEHKESVYNEFIRDFGTHYSKKVTLGALAGVRVFISEEKIRRLEKENIDVEAEFKYAGGFASVSGSASYNQSSENQRKIENSMSTTESYKIGGKFIKQEEMDADQNEAWADSARERPVPLNFRLEQISSMLTVTAFPDDPNIELKRDNLVRSLSKYCTYLEASGKVADCVSRDYPIKRAGDVGGAPTLTRFSAENDWNDMGKPMLARIDVQFFEGMIGGIVGLYRYGKEQRQASGAYLPGSVWKLYDDSGAKTWDQAKLFCEGKINPGSGQRPGRLAELNSMLIETKVQTEFYRYNSQTAPPDVWLGGVLEASNVPGDYQWYSGAPIRYNNFVTEMNDELNTSLGVVLVTDLDGWKKRNDPDFVFEPKWDARPLGEKKPFVCEAPMPTRSIDLAPGEYVTRIEVCTFNRSEPQGASGYWTSISSMTFETNLEHRAPEFVEVPDHDAANDTCTTIDLSDRLGLLYMEGTLRGAAPKWSPRSATNVINSLSFFSFKGEEQDYGDIPGLADIVPRKIVYLNNGLSGGAIAGIVVSVIALAALLIVGGFLYRRRKAAAPHGGMKAAILDDDQLAKNAAEADDALIGLEAEVPRDMQVGGGHGATGLGANGLGANGPGATGLGANGPNATGLGRNGLGGSGLGSSGLGVTGPIRNAQHATSVGERPPVASTAPRYQPYNNNVLAPRPSSTGKIQPPKVVNAPPSMNKNAPTRPAGTLNKGFTPLPPVVGKPALQSNRGMPLSSINNASPCHPPISTKSSPRNVRPPPPTKGNTAKKPPTRPTETPHANVSEYQNIRSVPVAPLSPANKALPRPPTTSKPSPYNAVPLPGLVANAAKKPPTRPAGTPNKSLNAPSAVVQHQNTQSAQMTPTSPINKVLPGPPRATGGNVPRSRPLPPSRQPGSAVVGSGTSRPVTPSSGAKVPPRPTGLSGTGWHPLPPNRPIGSGGGGNRTTAPVAASSSRADFMAAQRTGTFSKGKQW